MADLLELAKVPEVILLAAANSHTDASALRALSEFKLDNRILDLLKRCGYVWRAGNEWNIDSNLRMAVQEFAARSEPEIWRDAHSYYLSLTNRSDDSSDEPAYLRYGPGYAYHGTELDPRLGVEGYKAVAHVDSLAVSLEAFKLSLEQGDRGLLDLGSLDLLFLRAMTFYRMGRMHESIEILRRISHEDALTREVAVAQHLVAYWDCRRGDSRNIENTAALFKSSLKNAVLRNDVQHQSHVKHSMAVCMLERNEPNHDLIIKLLKSSLELNTNLKDEWGRAKILHTLGQALGQGTRSRGMALDALKESRLIGIRLGYQLHVAKVDETIERIGGLRPVSPTIRKVVKTEQNRKAKLRKKSRQKRRF